MRLAAIALLAVGLLVAALPYKEGVSIPLGDSPPRAIASCHPPIRGSFQGRFEGGYVGYAPDQREISVGADWCDRSGARRRLGVGVILAFGGISLFILTRRRPQAEPQTGDQ